MLPETIQFISRETDVVQDPFEQTLLERAACVEGDGDAAVARGSLEGAMAHALVGLFEAKAFEYGDQFSGG